MDPLSSLGLACNVIQLIDFGAKLIKQGSQIALKGQTDDHAHIQILAEDAQDLCKLLLGTAPQRNRLTPTLATRIADMQAQSNSGSRAQLMPAQEESVTSLATKTQEAAANLNALLQNTRTDPQAKGAGLRAVLKRKYVAAKQVVKVVHHDERIQCARRNLQELQQAMILHLSLAQSQSSSQIVACLGEITKEARESRIQLLKLAHIKTDEVSEQCAHSDDPAMHTLAGHLSILIARSDDLSVWMLALRTLAFEEMNLRAETIAESHASTYEWLFTNHELGFTNWLTNKDGCFWITGKPGSGKSTLMRYITQDERTRKLLATWAGSERLVVLDHYFWSSGSKIQKSVDGFLRTLLHQLIRVWPELVTEVQPASWWLSTGFEFVWFGASLRKAIKACGSAFRRLNIRVCMFVDGLDECEDEQHAELIELISWMNRSSNIKVCTASRPWNVFKNAYERKTDGSLTMQSLTHNDIYKYVTDKLAGHDHFQHLSQADSTACDAFTLAIVERADGVFLWVTLVLRSLLRGLDNEDTMRVLHLRLLEYPTSLDGYYQRMLDRIEDIYRSHSARILLSVIHDFDFRPSDIVLLETEMMVPGFAVQSELNSGGSHAEQIAQTVTGRYLDARCGDFLEVRFDGNARHTGRINFVHRTACDFMLREQIYQRLYVSAGSSFDFTLSIARRALMRFKDMPSIHSHACHAIGRLIAMVILASASHKEDYRALLREVMHHMPYIEGLLESEPGLRITATYTYHEWPMPAIQDEHNFEIPIIVQYPASSSFDCMRSMLKRVKHILERPKSDAARYDLLVDHERFYDYITQLVKPIAIPSNPIFIGCSAPL